LVASRLVVLVVMEEREDPSKGLEQVLEQGPGNVWGNDVGRDEVPGVEF
jgi:hypothetical protein